MDGMLMCANHGHARIAAGMVAYAMQAYAHRGGPSYISLGVPWGHHVPREICDEFAPTSAFHGPLRAGRIPEWSDAISSGATFGLRFGGDARHIRNGQSWRRPI